MTRTKNTFLSLLAISVLGVIALFFLFPLLDAPQPRRLSITRSEARKIADRQAKELGIPFEQAWGVMEWEDSPILEEHFEKHPDLRRKADADPAVGPRLGVFRVTYFRKGLEKRPEFASVWVGGDGRIVGARRFARAEEGAPAAAVEELRAKADAFVRSREFPGAPDPVFDSVRPNVLRTRTDHQFRYRVTPKLPVGRVALYLSVFFIGDKESGWMLLEEYADGGNFRFDMGESVAGTLLRFVLIFSLLLILLIIFLRKYHAGEVGVGTGAFLFGTVIVLSLIFDVLICREASINSQMGGMDAPTTALAIFAFKFLFFDIPVAVMIFLAWSVGESYARERWGDRLASFDAILRRDAINATVGRSVLTGLLTTPAVAAASLAVSAIPIFTGLAHPILGPTRDLVLATSGGPLTAVIAAALDAIVLPVTAFLFMLALASRKRVLAVGILFAAVFGALFASAAVAPLVWSLVFGFGCALAASFVFLYFDLLAAATALFGSGLVLTLVPMLRAVSGDARTGPLLALVIPLLVAFGVAVAGLLTRREIIYRYEDLAPHVRRIIERERVKAEIDAANRIQAALLPTEDPHLPGVSFASHYRAASEIGGDYFDFLPLPNGLVAVAFGDVAGHGLTSGIVMAMTKAALLVQVDYDSTPRRVMEVLNKTVMKTAPKRMLMTFFFGLLDAENQSIRFSSAGHLDPYVYRARTKAVESLSAWGFPLGVARRDSFREMTVSFEPGDRLILYSDGFIEALDDEGEPFGFDRFEKVLADSGHASADEIKKSLLQSVKRFTHNRPPEDDQTLVVISFDGIAVEQLSRPA